MFGGSRAAGSFFMEIFAGLFATGKINFARASYFLGGADIICESIVI
jgi:hypothetical protein